MLKPDELEKNLLYLFNATLPTAFEQAMLEMNPEKSERNDKAAKKFGETVRNLLAEEWAKTIAQAIDYYVKNADVHGQMMLVGIPTVGSPSSHTSLPHMVSAQTIPTGQGGGMIPGPNKFIFGIK
jgi:hypothetical protein